MRIRSRGRQTCVWYSMPTCSRKPTASALALLLHTHILRTTGIYLARHAAGKILVVADAIVHRAVPFASVVVNEARDDICAIAWLHDTFCARALC